MKVEKEATSPSSAATVPVKAGATLEFGNCFPYLQKLAGRGFASESNKLALLGWNNYFLIEVDRQQPLRPNRRRPLSPISPLPTQAGCRHAALYKTKKDSKNHGIWI